MVLGKTTKVNPSWDEKVVTEAWKVRFAVGGSRHQFSQVDFSTGKVRAFRVGCLRSLGDKRCREREIQCLMVGEEEEDRCDFATASGERAAY